MGRNQSFPQGRDEPPEGFWTRADDVHACNDPAPVRWHPGLEEGQCDRPYAVGSRGNLEVGKEVEPIGRNVSLAGCERFHYLSIKKRANSTRLDIQVSQQSHVLTGEL